MWIFSFWDSSYQPCHQLSLLSALLVLQYCPFLFPLPEITVPSLSNDIQVFIYLSLSFSYFCSQFLVLSVDQTPNAV